MNTIEFFSLADSSASSSFRSSIFDKLLVVGISVCKTFLKSSSYNKAAERIECISPVLSRECRLSFWH